MNRVKRVPLLIVFLVVMVSAGMALFFSKSYYPALPFEDIKKREVLNKIEASNGELILLQSDSNMSWYGYKVSLPGGKQALVDLMLGRDLTFIEQLGSGYFFEDSMGNRVIVESQQWTGRYILFKVPN